MKEVVRRVVSDFTLLGDEDIDKFYIVDASDEDETVFGVVAREHWDSGSFRPIAMHDGTTNGNGLTEQGSSLTELFKKALDRGWKVYEFETAKEMIEWIAKKL